MESITTVADNDAACAALSNDELVRRVNELASGERRASAALIRSLVEFTHADCICAKAAPHSLRIARRCCIYPKDRLITVSKLPGRRSGTRLYSTRSNAATSR